MKRTALASMLLLALFSTAIYTHTFSLAEENPNLDHTGADWRYVTTITGTGYQNTTVFVPNTAHLKIYGTCTTGSGTAQLGVYFGSGGSVHNYSSAGPHSFGSTTLSSRSGPANLSLVIQTSNVLNYTVIIEYDASASATAPTPSPTPTPTPYQEPQLTEQEAILGAVVIVAVTGAGLGTLLYLVKRK